MIFAIDFDGTIVENKFPDIGNPNPGAIETIKALLENGHKVFLWTMRGRARSPKDRDTLGEALSWLSENGIKIPFRSPAQFSTSQKQFAHVYIDDASFGAPKTENGDFDWMVAGKSLWKAGIINEEQWQRILRSL